MTFGQTIIVSIAACLAIYGNIQQNSVESNFKTSNSTGNDFNIVYTTIFQHSNKINCVLKCSEYT